MALLDNIKSGNMWNVFRDELKKVERDGIDDLIAFLEDKTDIKVAPASSKYHSNFPSGLMYHSMKVKEYLDFTTQKLEFTKEISSESRLIVALAHDFCKLNFYVIGKEWDKEHKNKTGEWREKKVYKIENKLPLGHGEKSLVLINKFISMTPDEMSAVRWHMGAWEQSLHFYNDQSQSYRDATARYPLVKALQIADQMAELYETEKNKDYQFEL